MVHKCSTEGCNAMIDEKYDKCLPCVDKDKAKNSTGSNSKIEKSLELLNGNLYALRQLKAIEIEQKYKIVLELDESTGKYTKRKLGKAKK